MGVAKRVIVMDLSNEEEPAAPQCFVNPKITWTSDEMGIYNEGCLSVPEYYADVERPSKCRVKYLDYDGAKHEIKVNGLLATCIQHEMDHLNGILIIERLTSQSVQGSIQEMIALRRQELSMDKRQLLDELLKKKFIVSGE